MNTIAEDRTEQITLGCRHCGTVNTDINVDKWGAIEDCEDCVNCGAVNDFEES